MGVRKVIVREMQRLTSLATTTPSESMRNIARKLSKDKNRNDIARNLARKLKINKLASLGATLVRNSAH